METILAYPELTPDSEGSFDYYGHPKENKQATKEFLARNPRRSGKFQGYPVWSLDTSNGAEVIATTPDKQYTVYAMEYLIEHFALLKGEASATQIKVWRNRKIEDTKRFPMQGIKNLFNKVPIIVCDGRQTQGGKKFWIKFMEDTLLNGRLVGFINFEDKTINVCPGHNDFVSWMIEHSSYWKYSDERYQRYRFFASRALPTLTK